MAEITTIVTGITEVSSWFFNLFSTLVNTIVSTPMLLYTVIVAIAFGTIGLLVKVIRQFGVRGR